MGSPVLVPCLAKLRSEFNELAPDRDTESDGWIGDSAHQAEPSDHNPDETGNTPYEDADSLDEVHAIDVDKDLNRPGWSMERAVQVIVGRHRSGADKRLNYVIFNRRIWGWFSGWTEREYFGANPHDKHAHFSSLYGSGAGNPEADVRAWGLLEADEEDEMGVEEFFASVARGVRGEAAGATATDRANRDAFAVSARFALGYNWNQQQGDGARKTVLGLLDEIRAAQASEG